MRALSAFLLVLVLLVGCEASSLIRIEPPRSVGADDVAEGEGEGEAEVGEGEGEVSEDVEPIDDDDIHVDESFARCADALPLLDGCAFNVGTDQFSGFPARAARPPGELHADCDVDAFVAEQVDLCGPPIDVDVDLTAEDTLAAALEACPGDRFCRLHLSAGRGALPHDSWLLHCAFLDGQPGTELTSTGGVGWLRAGARGVHVEGGLFAEAHALFVDVDLSGPQHALSVAHRGNGDVRVCGSVVRGGTLGIGVGNFDEPVQGLRIDHSVVAGCNGGVLLSAGVQGAVLSNNLIAGGGYAIEAGTGVAIVDTAFAGPVRVGAQRCVSGGCGLDGDPCDDVAVDYTVVSRDRYEIPWSPYPASVTCEPRLTATLAGTVGPTDLAPLGILIDADEVGFCVETVRFFSRFSPETTWWRTGDSTHAIAAVPANTCDSEMCGTLILPDGSEREHACQLTAICDGGFNGNAQMSLTPGHLLDG